MLKKEEKKQLIKVAKMYYFEELTQAKIAEKFGVSRPVISKMLQKARDEGIVEINIHDEGFDLTELEQKIARYFQLNDVVVTSTENLPEEQTAVVLGRVTAQYVSNMIKKNVEKIGVSWGKALYHMVKEYPIENRDNIKVIPLVGGIGPSDVELHANQIAYEFAKKINGESESLYAPAMVDSVALKEELIRLPHISSVLEQGRNVDLAIVGIGNPFQQSTLVEIGYLGEKEFEDLRKGNVVGDIGSKYIRKDGQEANHTINQRVIGIELNDLKKIERVIGVAAGIHKVDSILAVLKGGYLDILITDDQTAFEMTKQMTCDD